MAECPWDGICRLMRPIKTVLRRALVLGIVFSVACASKEMKPVAAEFARPTSQLSKIDQPQALNPEFRDTSNRIVLNSYGDAAVMELALIGTIIGIGKILQTPEIKTDLNGNCVYWAPDSLISSPCNNVTVNLLDHEKKIVTTSSTNYNGDFRFYIPAGKSYFVELVDRKGRTAATNVKVGRSELVSLTLRP